MTSLSHFRPALTICLITAFVLASPSPSDTDCPDVRIGGCALCKGVRYEEGIQFGTCEIPGTGPTSFEPADNLPVEPADDCYGFRDPGVCFTDAPGEECPDDYLCCRGGTFGYWTRDQIVWSSCNVEHWCDEFCCANAPTLRTRVEPCAGAPVTMIHYCE